MSCTKVVPFMLLLLSACATSQPPGHDASAQTNGQPPSTEDIDRYQQALNMLADNKLQDASTTFKDFTQHHPDLAGPWANLGLISIKQGNLEDAEKYFNEALKHNPRLPAALNMLGVIAYSRGNIRQAEKFFLDALASNPDYSMAHYNIALLYDIFLQDISRAITHYEKYLQLTGDRDKKTQQWLEELRATQKRG